MSEIHTPNRFKAAPDAAASAVAPSLPLRRDVLDLLAREGLISPDMRQDALARLHPAHSWGRWSLLLMAISGTSLTLSGILFFFAFNWTALSSFEKFGLLQGSVLLTATGAALFVRKAFVSQLLLLAASVFVGVFLAVFGQIYQTGADAWQLFALWALLILPWTLLSRFVLQWVLWFGLVNLAVALWWDFMPWQWASRDFGLMTALTFLNGLALGLRETLRHHQDFQWLGGGWTRWLLVGGILCLMFIPLRHLLAFDGIGGDSFSLAVQLIAILSYGLIFALYRFIWLDLPALAIWALCCCLVVLNAALLLLDKSDLGTTASIFLLAGLAIALFSFSAGWLKRLGTQSEGDHD